MEGRSSGIINRMLFLGLEFFPVFLKTQEISLLIGTAYDYQLH